MGFQRPFWYIIILFFLLGIGAIALALNARGDVPVNLLDSEDLTIVEDSILYQCEEYDIQVADPTVAKSADVKWDIDGKWVHEKVVENFRFKTEGAHYVDLYLDGRKRMSSTFDVIPCAGAIVDIPSNIIEGDTKVMRDRTPGSIGRRWFINGVEHADEGGERSFKFEFANEYVIRALIEMPDTIYEFTEEVRVKAKRVEPVKKTFAEDKSEIKKQATENKEVTSTKPKEIIEKTEEPVEEEKTVFIEEEPEVVEKKTMIVGGFNDRASFEFGKAEVLSWSPSPAKNCLEFNSERRSITLRDLTSDLCITKLYLMPNAKLKGNRVEVIVSNSNPDIDPRRTTKTLTDNRGNPSMIDIEEVGCGLVKGQSYTISIRPKGTSEVADVDVNDNSCFDSKVMSDYGTVIISGKSKILKMEMKHD
jgi:hypothetical protein